MLFLPTGGGKTVLFNFIANESIENNAVVLILAHREELVFQAAEKYKSWFGGRADIIKGGHRRERLRRLKVGSVQTVSRRIKIVGQSDKLGFFPKPKLIIIDEGHHVMASTYKKIIDHFPEALFLYVTATPCRLGGKGFRPVTDRLILGSSVKELEDLWRRSGTFDTGLCPDKILNIMLYSEIKKVKKKRGDYDSGELNKILNTDQACRTIVDAYIKHGEDRYMIAFCVKGENPEDKKRMHERLAEKFNEAGIPASSIDAETDSETRKHLLNKLRNREIRVITNMELFTEGFDAPAVDGIILARPTLSLSLYLQMVGRGKRPNGPEKQYNLLMDFVGNVLEHGTPNQDREWTIDSRPKKPKKDTYVKHDGEIMRSSELPETFGKPVYYEVLHIDEPFRVKSFDKTYENKKDSVGRHKAGLISLNQFLRKVKGKPSKMEMRYIASKVVVGGSKSYKKDWGLKMHQRYSFVMDLCERAETLDALVHADAALEEFLMYAKPENPDIKSKMVGYDTIKAFINKKRKSLVELELKAEKL